MAQYFVDLSLPSGGTGAPGDPFGCDDFIAHTNMSHVSDHSYMMRGIVDLGSENVILNSLGSNNPSFEAWDHTLYGPWRIKSLKLVAIKAVLLEGAVIESDGDLMVGLGNSASIVRGSMLRNNSGAMIISRAEGSSLIGTGDAKLYVGSLTQLYETTVDHTLQLDVPETGLEIGFSSLVFQDLAFPDIG